MSDNPYTLDTLAFMESDIPCVDCGEISRCLVDSELHRHRCLACWRAEIRRYRPDSTAVITWADPQQEDLPTDG